MLSCPAWQVTYEGSVSISDVWSSAVFRCRYLPTYEWEKADVVLSSMWPPCRVQQTHRRRVRCVNWMHVLRCCHAMLCNCGLCVCHAVFVCVSVTFVDYVETNKHIFRIFSLLGSHTILIFPHQMVWQYSDGKLPNGGVGCRWGKQKLRFSANIWLHSMLCAATASCYQHDCRPIPADTRLPIDACWS